VETEAEVRIAEANTGERTDGGGGSRGPYFGGQHRRALVCMCKKEGGRQVARRRHGRCVRVGAQGRRRRRRRPFEASANRIAYDFILYVRIANDVLDYVPFCTRTYKPFEASVNRWLFGVYTYMYVCMCVGGSVCVCVCLSTGALLRWALMRLRDKSLGLSFRRLREEARETTGTIYFRNHKPYLKKHVLSQSIRGRRAEAKEKRARRVLDT